MKNETRKKGEILRISQGFRESTGNNDTVARRVLFNSSSKRWALTFITQRDLNNNAALGDGNARTLEILSRTKRSHTRIAKQYISFARVKAFWHVKSVQLDSISFRFVTSFSSPKVRSERTTR